MEYVIGCHSDINLSSAETDLMVRAVGIEPTTHDLKTPGGYVWSEF